MDPIDAFRATSDWYAAFAGATRVSSTYAEWARAISGDAGILELIDQLPQPKRQPNLVLGATRYLGVEPGPYAGFRAWLTARWPEVAAVAIRRSTQTNEVGRCAVLVPLLAEIEGPVALLEVGASAGLCLYPDRYSYRYETSTGPVALDPPDGPSRVVLSCRLDPAAAVPDRLPDVVWRGGIDLNPLDVTDPDDLAWLSALIWPGQDARVERLREAARIVADEPPSIVAGDLNDALRATAERAPAGARLVVFHSAVLAYLDVAGRAAFVDSVRELDAVWISNEGMSVLPDVADLLPTGIEVGERFVLARDGVPRALAHPHGAGYLALA